MKQLLIGYRSLVKEKEEAKKAASKKPAIRKAKKRSGPTERGYKKADRQKPKDKFRQPSKVKGYKAKKVTAEKSISGKAAKKKADEIKKKWSKS